MKTQPHLLVRLERCLGCRSCELACAVAHSHSKTLSRAIFETAPPRRRIFVEGGQGFKAPIFCRHCEDAPCARVCPTGALGADPASRCVGYEDRRCIGCSSCVLACPFGAIQEGGASSPVVKCDLCIGREIPACVEACPTKALQLGSEFEKARRKQVVRQMTEAMQMGHGAGPKR